MKTAVLANGVEIIFPASYTKAEIDEAVRRLNNQEPPPPEVIKEYIQPAMTDDMKSCIEALRLDLKAMHDEIASLRTQLGNSSADLNDTINTAIKTFQMSMTINAKVTSDSASMLYKALTAPKILETDASGKPVSIKVSK